MIYTNSKRTIIKNYHFNLNTLQWNLVDSGPLLSIFIIIVNDIHNIQHVWAACAVTQSGIMIQILIQPRKTQGKNVS